MINSNGLITLAASTCLLLQSSTTRAQSTYQFPVGKSPYKDRNHVANSVSRIDLKLNDSFNGTYDSPYVGHIFYPDTPGKYPWVDFFGGFFGIFPVLAYQGLIDEIVQMGFILTYTLPHGFVSGDGNTNVTVWAEQNKFYKEIGPELVIKHSDGAVQMDASLQAQMSHSAGGQILKELMIADPGAAKAYYPQDSVFSPPKDAEADIPVQFTSNPVIVVQSTEWCSRCCSFDANHAKRDFESFYGYKTKTYDILQEAGHCSMLNYLELRACKAIHFCKQEDVSYLDNKNHLRCMAGIAVAAFTDGFFEGREDVRPYYTDPAQFCSDYVVPDSFVCEGEC